MERFTEKQIVNFEFFKMLAGVFCYKTDTNNNVIAYAYISSINRLLILKDLDRENYEIYDWKSNNPNIINEHKHEICEFLGELAVRPLLERGTTYEKKIAKTFWQLFIPQESAPQKLIQIVNKEFKTIIKEEL